MALTLDKGVAKALAMGGGLLGAGGGGDWQEGVELLNTALAIGRPSLIELNDITPETVLVTVSGVGAPAATDFDVAISDYLASLSLFMQQAHENVGGLVSSENGGFSSANGFVQSALTGLPVVDAPGNGRAHPTGVMGSMGLHRLPYRSKQAAVGGKPGERDVHLYLEGTLQTVDHVVREAAVAAGGLVAVTRNPVKASYVGQHGAPGALRQAIEVGEIILQHAKQGGRVVAERVIEFYGDGAILADGEVAAYSIETQGGYDTGSFRIGNTSFTFWNEYMTADTLGSRKATFPDLIFSVDAQKGVPVTSAHLSDDARIVLGYVPKECLILGAGVKDAALLSRI